MKLLTEEKFKELEAESKDWFEKAEKYNDDAMWHQANSMKKVLNSMIDKCSCKEPHYGYKTVSLCTDCNGIKDEEYWKNIIKNR